MGRNAKLRKQRRSDEAKGTTAQSQKSLSTAQSTLRAEVALKSNSAAATSTSTPPKTGLFGKLFSRFKSPLKKTPAPSIEANEFFLEQTQALAAIAWQGYKTYGRGIVFAIPSDQPTVQIEYVPRKILRKYIDQTDNDLDFLSDMLEDYNPKTGLIAVYFHPSGETIATPLFDLEPSPPDCYRQQEKEQRQETTHPI